MRRILFGLALLLAACGGDTPAVDTPTVGGPTAPATGAPSDDPGATSTSGGPDIPDAFAGDGEFCADVYPEAAVAEVLGTDQLTADHNGSIDRGQCQYATEDFRTAYVLFFPVNEYDVTVEVSGDDPAPIDGLGDAAFDTLAGVLVRSGDVSFASAVFSCGGLDSEASQQLAAVVISNLG